ncbi:MAG TPA: c-type cytochrome domain-containing protein [Candidatus Limnocylindria bacterium]|jgi:uncharacterized membrane protein|nr:c-type cytochrome domain-containing protein [Candidatus Limnocylindria bacterium]
MDCGKTGRKILRHLLLLLPLMAMAASSPEVAKAGFSWARFLGPFHMVVLHFPIGFLTLAAVLEMVAFFKPFEGAHKLITLTLGLSGIAAVLTVILGLMRAAGGDYAPDVLAIHRFAGIAVAALSIVTWLLHRALTPAVTSTATRIAYRCSLAITLGALTVAGHQGGTLTHGKGFLSANGPAALKSMLGEDGPQPATPAVATAHDPNSELAVAAWDILARRCYSCHGPEKQKGKLRLDSRESILKGGDSGEVVLIPGDPLKSKLLRVVTLPRNNDDAMPPDGKEGLTPQEIVTLLEWVQAGAPATTGGK